MADLSVSRAADDLLRQKALYGLGPPPLLGTEKPDIVEALVSSEAQSEEYADHSLSEKEQDAFAEAIQQLDELLKPLSIGLNVTRIEALNRLYVQLLDRETGEILREIPSRKILEMQENIRAFQGLLFDKFS